MCLNILEIKFFQFWEMTSLLFQECIFSAGRGNNKDFWRKNGNYEMSAETKKKEKWNKYNRKYK